jgi:biopolymer transport protein ExbD
VTTSLLPEKPTVLVVADEEVPLKFVTQVVDLCRQNGLEDFRLQAR